MAAVSHPAWLRGAPHNYEGSQSNRITPCAQSILLDSIITGIKTNAVGFKISSEPGGRVLPKDDKCGETVGNRFLPKGADLWACVKLPAFHPLL